MSLKKGPVIAIAAGGTGGHIFPAIATGEKIRELRPDIDVVYACGEKPLEIGLFKSSGIEPVVFPARQIRRGMVGKFTGIVAAFGNLWRAWCWVRRINADVVMGFGGYVSGPTVLGGIFAGRKTAIHEANSVPGVTNKVLAPLVTLTTAHFESTLDLLKGKRELALGMPLRRLEFGGSKEDAREELGLDKDRMTILVIGGSQGAKFLYHSIMDCLTELDTVFDRPVQILWSTGQNNLAELAGRLDGLALKNIKVHLQPFLDNMAAALATTDLAIARAGASSLAELVSFGVYTIYVPFPAAIYDHQTLNAREAEQHGLGRVLPEPEVKARLVELVRESYAKVQNGYTMRPPESLDSSKAAERLARNVIEMVG